MRQDTCQRAGLGSCRCSPACCRESAPKSMGKKPKHVWAQPYVWSLLSCRENRGWKGTAGHLGRTVSR